MAEAIAALSLASNILQVVDYGTNFLSGAWKIWRSGKDGLEGLTSLQLLSQDLKAVLERLRGTTKGVASQVEDESTRSIFALAEECTKITQQMLDSIESLKILEKTQTSRKKRDALIAAFKLIWKNDEIVALQSRLDTFKSQMILNLAVSFRFCMKESLEKQDTILRHLVQSRNDNHELKTKINSISSREDGLGSALIEYLVQGLEKSTSRSTLERSLRFGLLDAIYDTVKLPDNDASFFEISPFRKGVLEKKFVSKLSYDSMYDREHMVAEAHQTTFRWIFEPEENQHRPWANFRRLLESDQQLYWITGKAGSGKSTLMKYISQPFSSEKEVYAEIHWDESKPRCAKFLHGWAKEKPLLAASFYFWAAGSKVQTSKEGLYRTLLSQILRACPDAIAHASPERWEALCLFNEDSRPLRETELRTLLVKAITFVSATFALCLFIDGLDEFDGQLDDLIKLIKDIIQIPSVKVCVASRPWLVFEDALKDKPHLQLEDLTYDDIKLYVTSRFESNPDFSLLQENEAEFARDLIKEVVKKASGVFLWVNLVVSSLLHGMKSGDRVCDLQMRLDQLPCDLEALYGNILDNLDPFYLNHAAQYFYLMLACKTPPEALLLSSADEEDLEYALKLPIKPLSDNEIRNRTEMMRRRLNSRCMGLIGIPELASGFEYALDQTIKAQYLHRTVKDYIKRSCVQEKLSGMLKAPFDPHLRLCSGALATCKSHDGKVAQTYDAKKHRKLFRCMLHARQVMGSSVSAMIRMLDELENTVSGRVPMFGLISDLQATVQVDKALVSVSTHVYDESFGNTLLSFAVKCQVLEYVKQRMEPGCRTFADNYSLGVFTRPQKPKKPSWNPLKFLSEDSEHRHTTSGEWPLLLDAVPSIFASPAMVSALLRNGADPNSVIDSWNGKTSVWIETIICLVSSTLVIALSKSQSAMWMDILQIMIKHGANIEKKTIAHAIKRKDEHNMYFHDQKHTVSVLRQLVRNIKLGKFDRHFDLTTFMAARLGLKRDGERKYRPRKRKIF